MYQKNALPVSVDRWRITGRIETLSPLHIGDGDRIRISERNCDRHSLDWADPSYATVHIGHNGKPVIPATSLKGALRAWAEVNHLDPRLIEEVFGNQEGGGTVTFHDAPLERPRRPRTPRRAFGATSGRQRCPLEWRSIPSLARPRNVSCFTWSMCRKERPSEIGRAHV